MKAMKPSMVMNIVVVVTYVVDRKVVEFVVDMMASLKIVVYSLNMGYILAIENKLHIFHLIRTLDIHIYIFLDFVLP